MTVFSVVSPCPNKTLVKIVQDENTLYCGTVGNLIIREPIWDEVKWRKVRLVTVSDGYLAVSLRPKLLPYIIVLLCGLVFGWSMQGVWF